MELLSIKDAVSKGIDRLRKSIWITPEDHIKIDIIDGVLGPWIHIYAPFNKECNGRDPVEYLILQFDCDKREWLPYSGPLPDSAEYKAKVKSYEGCLNETIRKD